MQMKSSLKLDIPQDWLSGVYLGRMTTIPEGREAYWQSYVVFIVRDERPVDILFQCSDNTWQAYNVWPNKYSVYTHPKGNQGPWADVSFDRPYGREAQYTSVVNDPLSVGSGEFLPYEFPLAYWLEEHGYDVAYCSNSDMLTPDRGLKSKVFISVGHDEYWDIRQFRSVEKMRAMKVSTDVPQWQQRLLGKRLIAIVTMAVPIASCFAVDRMEQRTNTRSTARAIRPLSTSWPR